MDTYSIDIAPEELHFVQDVISNGSGIPAHRAWSGMGWMLQVGGPRVTPESVVTCVEELGDNPYSKPARGCLCIEACMALLWQGLEGREKDTRVCVCVLCLCVCVCLFV